MSKYIKLDDAIDAKCPFEDIWEDCVDCPLNDSEIKPCKMGKWLKSLPTIEVSEDAISREWIKNALLKYGFTAPDMTVTELIEDAPPVIPKPKEGEWIPCSERLPENSTIVLVQVDDMYHTTDTNNGILTGWRRGDYWYTFTIRGWETIRYPLAWMPLPEPWKGADDDN